ELTPAPGALRAFHVRTDAAFFGALAIAGCEPEVRRTRLEQLRAFAERLERWSEQSAPNYSAQAALVSGEVARAEGRAREAEEGFAIAAVRARRHRLLHIEGLAHESAARFCREQGEPRASLAHIRDAIECYRDWGAS